jgi:pimeloyl-ACP methyl ester carboxylesterase
MTSDELAIVSRDGTRIAFSRSGQGEPLVLVHGTSADRTRWARVLPELESQFTVYAVDRRGRGRSGDGADYAIEREFEDVTAVVDEIGKPVTLLGHSYGGMCALEASLRTSAVQRLILYEPPLPVGVEIYAPGLLDRLQQLLDAGDREAVLMTFMTEVVRMPAEHAEQLRSLPGWDARVAAAHTVVRETRAHDGYRFEPERWQEFAPQTLLLLGGDSPLFFVRATEVLAATLPHATLRLLPGQQHVAMETAPTLFVEAIRRFVADSPSG